MGAARVGKTLGNFRILECLGSGGAGMIWKAEDLSLGRIVALKALRAELAVDAEMSQRFRAEARALAKLSHPSVASLYSLIEDDDGLFLVLEYVEGSTLAALLATSGPLPLDGAFALFHQILDGVGHAHDAGVVHRDLKPANLMIDARGRVKVMDFGIARVAGAARTTHHGKLVGTPEYMSPEQVRGEDATVRSDVYSLGILLFEMVTGQPPFRGAVSFELMRAQIEDAPPDPRSLRPELAPAVATAILRALAKRPADRFASTHELQSVLLAAGASRRGRIVGPHWRDAPPASEAPTLLSGEAARSPQAAPAFPPGANARAPLEAALRGAQASGDEIDAGFAVADQAAPREDARGKAPATIVLDAMQETAPLEAVRPTRMLDDAPFAVSARSLAASSEDRAASAHGPRLLWAIAGVGLLALAVGAVRLHTREAPAAPPAATATPALHSSPQPPVPSPALEAAAEARDPQPPAVPPALAKLRAKTSKRSATPKPPAHAAQPPARAAQQGEGVGWVIRR